MELDLHQENGVDAEDEDEQVQEETVRKAQEFEAVGRPGIMRLQRNVKLKKFMPAHLVQLTRDKNTLGISNVSFQLHFNKVS